MQAVILAAGKGTRMRPLTYDIPKPMLPIKGKPVLEYTLSFLPDDIDEVIIVVNYLGKHIKKYFGGRVERKKNNIRLSGGAERYRRRASCMQGFSKRKIFSCDGGRSIL